MAEAVPPTNRYYLNATDNLERFARHLPTLMREMAPGDTFAVRRCEETEAGEFEVIQTRSGGEAADG
jgi:hypothetical protein